MAYYYANLDTSPATAFAAGDKLIFGDADAPGTTDGGFNYFNPAEFLAALALFAGAGDTTKFLNGGGTFSVPAGGGGGGAPTDAQYLTLAVNGTLTNERVLTAGTGITFTDGGAGSTLTVAVTANTYQPLDAELTAIAGLTSAADRLPYFTGSGTASLATFTAFGRSLVDDADATAGRATLELGSIATQAASAVAITGGSITGTAIRLKGSAPGTPADGDLWTDEAQVLARVDGSTTALLAAVNDLADVASASTARTNLGLAIGTNVLAYDAGVQQIADLADPNADRILFWDDSAGAYTFLSLGSGLTITGTEIAVSAGGGNVSTSGSPTTGDYARWASASTIESRTAAQVRSDLSLVVGTNVLAYDAGVQQIADLADPDADRILFWDDSAGAYTYLTVGTGLSITDTTLSATGGVSDGDKGDITVSASGATWTIDAGAVTFAKMQAVSANVLLGNDASGTTVEEITCTAAGRALLDDADATAQRATLGLGTIATQAASAVAITGGTVYGCEIKINTTPGTPAAGHIWVDDDYLHVRQADGGVGHAMLSENNFGEFAEGGNLADALSNLGLTGLTTQLLVGGGASAVPVWTTATGSGAPVRATSPTLVTPLLGTPTSGTLTNCTGLPISTGVSGLGTGVATFLATPSSANLAAAVTDETGSGALVFATSPTLTTPNIGTPSAGVLTNCTGLPAGGLAAGAANKGPRSNGSTVANAFPAGDLTTATDGATVTFDLAVSCRQIVTLGGNRTLALSNDADGMAFTLILKQDGTGSRTVTWWSGVKWPAGTTPTLTTTAGKYDVFAFVRIASGEYLGFAGSLNH